MLMPNFLVVLSAALACAQPQSPVIEAVHKGHAIGHEQDGVDAVRAALAAGGDINERDKSGWTPLMHAALECRAEITKLLLDKGANLNPHAESAKATSYVDHGQSALHIAASCFIARRRATLAPGRGMPESYVRMELEAPRKLVRSLIQAGADVNTADADGRTPLMMAAMHGWPGVVEELLAAKASVKARDSEGRIAIDYADPEDREIVAQLSKAGSAPSTGQSGRYVCDAERALDRLGFSNPIIDCILGQQLTPTIIRFQKEHNLPSSGELDPETRKALKIR